MPKEYIHNRYFGQYEPLPIITTSGPIELVEREAKPIDASAVKVGWSREAEHVEIAIIRDYGLENLDGSGDWHTQLDRAGINRLIRTLRKARDAAYGSDA